MAVYKRYLDARNPLKPEWVYALEPFHPIPAETVRDRLEQSAIEGLKMIGWMALAVAAPFILYYGFIAIAIYFLDIKEKKPPRYR